MVRAMGLLPGLLDARLFLASNAFPKDIEKELALDPGWPRIDNHGSLTRWEIVALLAQVRAGLVLFHPEPNHVPAMPHKLFEYMGAGIPVIASNFPAWREIVLENRCGILVDPLDPAAIAKAIEFILTHAQEAEQMGLRGRLAAKGKYNWQTEEQQLLEFYSGFQQRTESRTIMVQSPSERRVL
jgi:glycosyltransferase involved in cell wall biosynthesis